jgi:hypothetical protein
MGDAKVVYRDNMNPGGRNVAIYSSSDWAEIPEQLHQTLKGASLECCATSNRKTKD